jgi:hypothetical protein
MRMTAEEGLRAAVLADPGLTIAPIHAFLAPP